MCFAGVTVANRINADYGSFDIVLRAAIVQYDSRAWNISA